MTTSEQNRREVAERYAEGVRSVRAFIRREPPPAPGRSLSERERAEAQRKAREDAAAQQAEERRLKAAEARQAAIDAVDRAKGLMARARSEAGSARHALRLAVEAGDFDAAEAAATRIAALALVEEELKQHGKRLGAQNRGPAYYRLDAGKV